MKNKTFFLFTVCVLVFSLWGPADGKIYQWQDENGVLHYSDVAPGGAETQIRQPLPESPSGETEIRDSSEIDTRRFARGMLWRITGKGVAPSYLLGTIHSEDKRVLNLSAALTTAIDQANSFTMEVVLDEKAFGRLALSMIYMDGNDLKTVLGENLFNRVSAVMGSYGVPPAALVKMKPWAVLATLSMPRSKTGQFLDMVLYHRAKNAGKSIYGLETVEEQIAVFEDTPIADQIRMIEEALDSLPEFPKQFEEMLTKYLDGDLQGIKELAEAQLNEGDPEIARRFYRRLNQDRNLRMIEGIVPRLEEGNAFIAVGALHLAGSEGLLWLIEQRGYQVQAVN